MREASARCGSHPAVLGLLVGNELPADVVRCHGYRAVQRLLDGLYEAGRQGDPTCLLGYANYPTTGYLDTSRFDFDCMNVFLEDVDALHRYLLRLRRDSGRRPLLLGEVGLDSLRHGEARQAHVLDAQLQVCYTTGVAGTCVFSFSDDWWVAGNRVEDWRFGITRVDRTAKPALDAVTRRHESGLLGSRDRWPRVSVVVCAYQAQETIGACLESLGRLRYPDYEVLVVDDGCTDQTAAMAAAHPVRLIAEGHRGLSGARNLGAEKADGEIVAYLDADAYADPDWLTYLVLGLDDETAVAVGGPNIVPPHDPPLSQAIFQAPGGPVPVLVDDGYAEHVPGCNMAYRRDVLLDIGGFDPVYTSAGDDADVCWKLLDRGHRIAYHPAALVYHHPRGTVRGFWRQQVGYGRAEAMLAARHPERFTADGHARWSGVVYPAASPLRAPSRWYTGRFGQAPYQRLYDGASVPIRHALAGVLALAAAAPVLPAAGTLALAGAVGVCGAALNVGRHGAREAGLPAHWSGLIGLLHLVQPVARECGRLRQRGREVRRIAGTVKDRPVARRIGRSLYTVDDVDGEARPGLLHDLHRRLTGSGLRARFGDEWGHTDLSWRTGPFWRVTAASCTTTGGTHLRLRGQPRAGAVVATAVVVGGCWASRGAATAAALTGIGALVAAGEGVVLGRRTRRALTGSPSGTR